MNVYQLDTKELDAEFLAGKAVKCNAVVKSSVLSSLSPGRDIVVQLSNRSKYKGTVLRFNYRSASGAHYGELHLIRRK